MFQAIVANNSLSLLFLDDGNTVYLKMIGQAGAKRIRLPVLASEKGRIEIRPKIKKHMSKQAGKVRLPRLDKYYTIQVTLYIIRSEAPVAGCHRR